jgi:two-component system, cell cycle sensor histidine kinase and response regulator CckA
MAERARMAARLVGLAGVYWLLGEAVFQVATVGNKVALVWPSAGVALAALLRWGPRYWPAVFAGALLVGFRQLPLAGALAMAAGNTLGPLLATALLGRVRFRPDFSRRADLGWFMAIGVGLLPVPGAVIGAVTLALLRSADPVSVAATWWLGDSLGVLLLAPLALADVRAWWRELVRRRRVAELVVVLVGLAAVAGGLFLLDGMRGRAALPVGFILWAAARLGAVGAGAAGVILAVITAAATGLGRGPFVLGDPTDAVWVIWTYLTVVSLGALIIVAVTSERDAAVAEAATGAARFQAIVQGSPDPICRFRPDGTLTFVNDAYCGVFGCARDHCLGRPFGTTAVEADRAVAAELLAALGTAQGPVTTELRVAVAGGAVRWLEWTARPIRDDTGRVVELQAMGRDVTDRRAAEDALRRSEARLRTIVDTEPECVKVVAADGTLAEMNPAGLAMIEAGSLEAVRGLPVARLIAPGDRAAFGALHRRVMGGEVASLEFSVIGLRGTERRMHSTAAPLRDDTGRVTAVLAVTRDVTEEQRARRERDEADRLVRRVTDVVPGILYLYDAEEQRPVFVNAGTTRILGFTPDEVLADPGFLPSRVHPDDWPRFQEHLASVLRTAADGAVLEFEYRVRHRDGSWRHLRSRDTVIARGPDGRVRQLVGVATDVTERHEAEARIRRLAAFPELNPAPVLELAADGRVTYANEAALAMAGVERAAEAAILLPPDAPAIVQDCLATGSNRLRVDVHRGAQTLSCSFFAIRALGAVHCYVSDATEAVEMRRQLERSQRMDSIGQLAGGVAHDFNNLLQVISGYATLARERGTTAEEREASLDHVLGAAERAAQLTRQLLAFGRRQALRVTDLDLNGVVSGMMGMLRRLIEARITVDFVPGFQVGNIRADRGQVEQVILNLCINARDAMPDGGRITIETGNVVVNGAYREQHPWAAPGRYVLLTVSDTGVGMDRDVLDRMFEPFFTTKPQDRGTGLGLAVVYGIVKQHDGMINVYSEPGLGTTFKIYFPVSARLAASVDAKLQTAPPRGTETVLVAEDEPSVRNLAVRLLERAGYRTLAARDGREAVAVFTAHEREVDLVLMDVVMPHLGGPEAYRQMAERRPGLRVLFASGYGGSQLPAAVTAGEGADLLDKPYDPDELLRAVRRVLDARPRPVAG